MAKELPYFKFESAEWLAGRIVLEPLETQGAYINVISLYWQRLGDLQKSDVVKRFGSELFSTLEQKEFILLDSDDNITIDFLDEQLAERKAVSKVRAKAGAKGGKANAKQMEANAKQKQAEENRGEENREEEKKEEKREDVIDPFNYTYLDNKFKEFAKTKNLDLVKVLEQFDRAYDFYDEKLWINTKGKKVIDPYSTIRNNWFKNLSEFAKPREHKEVKLEGIGGA